MIAISPDVIREGSNIPTIPDAVVSPVLENYTGADCMISKLDIPASKIALLREHITHRALLVQIKVGADYPSSFGNRLHMSQAKMKEASASPQQRWLLTVGVFTEAGGELCVNGRSASKLIPGQHYTYKAASTASRSWQLRGGCYHNCYNGEKLVEWLKETEEWLCGKHPEVVYATPDLPELFETDENDPFQMLRRITDGRLTLSTLPGIGSEKAQALWELSGGDLAVAIDYLLGNYELVKGNGVGKGIRAKVKQFFGSRLELARKIETLEGEY